MIVTPRSCCTVCAILLLSAGSLVAEDTTSVAAATDQGRVPPEVAPAAGWLDKPLTIDFTDVPLASAVEEIGRQAGAPCCWTRDSRMTMHRAR